MSISRIKFSKDRNGEYIDEDNVHFGNETISFLQSKFLGFCNCGIPDHSVEYVVKGLEEVNKISKAGDKWKEAVEKAEEVLGGEERMYFMWYFLDSKGLTNHGSSVPGWITDRGEQFLELYNELEEE